MPYVVMVRELGAMVTPSWDSSTARLPLLAADCSLVAAAAGVWVGTVTVTTVVLAACRRRRAASTALTLTQLLGTCIQEGWEAAAVRPCAAWAADLCSSNRACKQQSGSYTTQMEQQRSLHAPPPTPSRLAMVEASPVDLEAAKEVLLMPDSVIVACTKVELANHAMAGNNLRAAGEAPRGICCNGAGGDRLNC